MVFVVGITALVVLAAACQRMPPVRDDGAAEGYGGASEPDFSASGGGAQTRGAAGLHSDGGADTATASEGGRAAGGGRSATDGGEGGLLAGDTGGTDAGEAGRGIDGGTCGHPGAIELEMQLSVGFNLQLQLGTFEQMPHVVMAPEEGDLRAEGDQLVYSPRWGSLAPDRFVFERTQGGTLERTSVYVLVESPWLLMNGVAYRVIAVPGFERVFDAAGGVVFGEALGRGVRTEQGTLAVVEHEGAAAFLRRALPSGGIAGYSETPAGAVGLLFRSASGPGALELANGSAETRWFSGSATSLAGQARGGLFAEDRFQAVRCDARALDCVVLSPEAREDGRALFVDDEVTLGSVGVGATERACYWRSSRCDVPPGLEETPSRLVGRDRASRVLATVFDAWGYAAAATVSGADGLAIATLPTEYGVELTGYAEEGALTGALQRPDGTLTGMIAEEVDAGAGLGFREQQEPDDPSVRHACLHTQEGPFSALAATLEASAAPVMSRIHVSYSIALPPGGAGWIALSAPRAGDYSLFLDGPTGLAFEGDPSIEVRTLRSSHCERIRWIQELRLPKAGTFLIRLSSKTRERAALVLEAGHAFPWSD